MPSSMIEVMQYSPRTKALLLLYRANKGIYRYTGVPEGEWKAFRAAHSKGGYLRDTFNGKGYKFERLAGEARVKALEQLGGLTESKSGGDALSWGHVAAKKAL